MLLILNLLLDKNLTQDHHWTISQAIDSRPKILYTISSKGVSMDIKKLRALQGPLKERYQHNPESAIVSARAEGVVDGEDIVCQIPSHMGNIKAGLHSATGGDGSTACSADMLLEALVACAGVTLKAVATSMRLPFNRAKVIADGKWDARGTLAVDRTAPVGLKEISLSFEIDSAADPEKIKKLVQLTERYCVIYQTLVNPPKLESRYHVPLSPSILNRV